MNINRLIEDTLNALAPTSFGTYNSSEETYIVYIEYNQAPWLSADDKEMFTKHFYQVDVFSSGNYLNLVKDVKRAMKQVGFGRMWESETYEEEMKKFRKTLRFSYISEEE